MGCCPLVSQVMHTEGGLDMIKHFLTDISGLKPDWTMEHVLEEQLRKINELVRADERENIHGAEHEIIMPFNELSWDWNSIGSN